MDAVEGNVLSGVVVAKIIKSISSIVISDFSIAFFEAFIAKSDVFSFFDTKCLFLIPLLLEIHSSFVSINLERASFEKIFLGKLDPTLVIKILLEILCSLSFT